MKNESGVFKDYDCIGLTFFPRKEYDGVSDIRSFEDYASYVEEETKIIDMLSKKYNISCKLAVPMGLDYWNMTTSPLDTDLKQNNNIMSFILCKYDKKKQIV